MKIIHPPNRNLNGDLMKSPITNDKRRRIAAYILVITPSLMLYSAAQSANMASTIGSGGAIEPLFTQVGFAGIAGYLIIWMTTTLSKAMQEQTEAFKEMAKAFRELHDAIKHHD